MSEPTREYSITDTGGRLYRISGDIMIRDGDWLLIHRSEKFFAARTGDFISVRDHQFTKDELIAAFSRPQAVVVHEDKPKP